MLTRAGQVAYVQATVQIGGVWNQAGVGRVAPLPGRPQVHGGGAVAPTHETGDQVQLGRATPHRFLELPDGRKIGLPEQGRFEIGRQKECQVQLEGDLISRHHCQAEYRNGQLWVQDGSSNGTFVNGERLPKGQWVEVPGGAQLGFGQSVHTFKLGSAAGNSAPLQGPGGQSFEWPAGQEMVKVGRSPDSHLQPQENVVSGNHALLRRQGDKLMVLDTQSRNGTFINGERIESMRWTEVPAGGQLAFGAADLVWGDGTTARPSAPQPAGREQIKMPDGRIGLVEFRPDGSVHLGKVSSTVLPSEVVPGKYHNLSKGFAEVTGADQLQVGDRLMVSVGGGMSHKEVLGRDEQGGIQLGQSQTFATRQEYDTYLRNKQEAVDRAEAAAAKKQQERVAKAGDMRAQWVQKLGINLNEPAGAAQKLLAAGAPLGVDGQSVWPDFIEDQMVALKSEQMKSVPVPGRGTVESSGLLPLRMEQWKAEQRGEFLLLRGVVGEFSSESWGRFYTPDVGASVSYAGGLDHSKSGQVVALSIPKSDIPRFYRDVGSVPGRNPYAEVYDIGKGELPPERQPKVLLSNGVPGQQWVFDEYRRNAGISDSGQGQEDYLRLNRLVSGS